jgi:hypothetical protein
MKPLDRPIAVFSSEVYVLSYPLSGGNRHCMTVLGWLVGCIALRLLFAPVVFSIFGE